MPCHAMTWQAPNMYSMRAMPCSITGHDKPCSPWMPYHERPSKAPHLMTYLSKPPPHPASKKFWHHFLQISSYSYWTWPSRNSGFTMFYPWKIALFHSFLYVYQRISSTSHPFGFYLERLHCDLPWLMVIRWIIPMCRRMFQASEFLVMRCIH